MQERAERRVEHDDLQCGGQGDGTEHPAITKEIDFPEWLSASAPESHKEFKYDCEHHDIRPCFFYRIADPEQPDVVQERDEEREESGNRETQPFAAQWMFRRGPRRTVHDVFFLRFHSERQSRKAVSHEVDPEEVDGVIRQ